MASVTVTRVGHSMVLRDFDGAVVLTDPWFPNGRCITAANRSRWRLWTCRSWPVCWSVMAVTTTVILPRSLPTRSRASRSWSNGGWASGCGPRASAMSPSSTPGRARRWGPVSVTAAPAKHGVPEVTFVQHGAGCTVFFGADTLRVPELDEIAHRFPNLDLALLPVNGLTIRPAINKQVVMNAAEAADLTRVLHPRPGRTDPLRVHQRPDRRPALPQTPAPSRDVSRRHRRRSTGHHGAHPPARPAAEPVAARPSPADTGTSGRCSGCGRPRQPFSGGGT